MQNKFKLYRRSNGTLYAQEIGTEKRESLKTKDQAIAEQKLLAMNQAASQPAFNREMAKVYLRGTDPEFCERIWKDVAESLARQYDGPTAKRWAKFVKSAPLKQLIGRKLSDTGAAEMLAVLNHPKAGTSTNTFLRNLHNRALDLEWLLKPALSKRSWPKIKYKHRRGITREEHENIVAATKLEDWRLFFELLWETGGSQTDIACLSSEDIDWPNRRLYYERAKLASKGAGRACIAIGPKLEAILKKLPSEGLLFPKLAPMREGNRSAVFWKKRRKAGVEEGIVLHSYRYAWAERACAANMPEREAMAHLGHGSKAIHRAYARSAERVTMPLEYYEEQRDKKLVAFNPLPQREDSLAAA